MIDETIVWKAYVAHHAYVYSLDSVLAQKGWEIDSVAQTVWLQRKK